MSILFLCGSLEPGKDGVGDYTRRLAGELIRQGHQALLISMHDKYILSNEIITCFQNEEGVSIQTTRLSANLTWEKKNDLINQVIKDFKPTWISLQYVPYSFNNKGLPFDFVNRLKCLAGKGQWHIMFHELWIGISHISSLKHKLTGFFQKQIARKLVKTTHASFITTTNALYQTVLESAQIQARVLPLFSNIPVAKKDEQFIKHVYNQLDINPAFKADYKIIGTFGSLYPEVDLESAIAKELQSAKYERKQLAFISVGRIGKHGQEELKRLEGIFSGEVKFLAMGEQDATHVSLILQVLDKAISCTPGQHAGKSGVFAVMRLHNLPVVFPVFGTLPEYDTIIKDNHQLLMKKQPNEWSVEYIATSFLNLLSSN